MSDNLKVMLTLTVVGGEWPQSTITLGLPDQEALVEALCAEVRARVPRLLDGAGDDVPDEPEPDEPVSDEPETLPLGLPEAVD